MISNDLRIGQGYDVHQLIDGRPLIICGVKIPHSKGLLGHSDGDVGYHAICDAILGALALGDLGTYFPSSNSKWDGANSEIFLEEILVLMNNKNYSINNIDCTIILQSPHINQYIEQMKKNISDICHININQISVKATTTDNLGSIGREEGIGSSSVVLLKKVSNEG